MGKGEIARYEQFLLFPPCFQKTCTADKQKPGLVWERVFSWLVALPFNATLTVKIIERVFNDRKLTKDLHRETLNIDLDQTTQNVEFDLGSVVGDMVSFLGRKELEDCKLWVFVIGYNKFRAQYAVESWADQLNNY